MNRSGPPDRTKRTRVTVLGLTLGAVIVCSTWVWLSGNAGRWSDLRNAASSIAFRPPDPIPHPTPPPPPPPPLMSASRAASEMSLPEGFVATAFASEPDVTQPIALAFDHRGRLWVAECHSYGIWERDAHTDRVLIFEDTDGDGVFDTRKVFLDNVSNLTGIAVGFGGVWLCAAPKLLFVPDADADDQPDGPPVTLLDGWTPKDHHLFHGLTWGPDGWLYGEQGIFCESLVGRPGDPDATRTFCNVGVWRYHPVTRRFEVIARGMTNPWGFDFDDHGQMFVTNSVTDYLWYVLPGFCLQRWYGDDANPYVYEYMTSCADHRHYTTDKHTAADGGHAHTGAMIYLGDNWPDAFRNHVYLLNLHGRLINRDVITRSKSGYVASHGDTFARQPDPWYRGVDMKYGPDGGVFIIDWSEAGPCHAGSAHDTGRIYKIVHPPVAHPEPFDLSTMTDRELVALQLRANDWWVREARLTLQERAHAGALTPDARDALTDMLRHNPDTTRRLRALWALHVTGGVDEQILAELTTEPDEHLRAWAIRLAFEDGDASSKMMQRVERMALDDNPFVRMHIASSLQRIPPARRWDIVAALLTHDDRDDPNLALMTWYALEPLVPSDRPRAIRLLRDIQTPKVRQLLTRRIADD
ncbi:MAG: hypothetical protein GC159_09465 [Phycisphaera sp.]|nr:hypothetical protein [Phycisphaera sp.]